MKKLDENEEKMKIENGIKQGEETKQETSDYSFIEEKIKERPLNKRKLVRKSLLTAGSAIIFGAVACITFLCLEPLFSKIITSDTEMPLQQVTIPEVTDSLSSDLPDVQISDVSLEEITIDDQELLDNLNVLEGDNGSEVVEDTSAETTTIVQNPQMEIKDYQYIYRKMYAIAEEVGKSLVTVTGVTSDVDWLNSTYESSAKTTGVIIGSNGIQLLILADCRSIQDSNKIYVTFCDGTMCQAELKRMDEVTGLAIYSISLRQIPAATQEAYAIATIGSSYSGSLQGGLVIAIGNPTGVDGSVCMGAITSSSMEVSVPDANYQIITTDIYGSKDANGVLLNVNGQIIGFINQDHNSEEMRNMIYAYGFSSIRKLVENLSNDRETTYMGVYLTDIVEPAKTEYNLPQGAYITKVDINSPAMNVGINSGDIIVGIDDRVIVKVSDYVAFLAETPADTTVHMKLMRLSGDEYKLYEVDVRLDGR